MKPEETLAWTHDGTGKLLAALAAYLSGRQAPARPAAPPRPAWL
jgi:hypothetical protein